MMSDIVDTQRLCFTVVWKIKNFSLAPKLAKNENIRSRTFVADNLDATFWFLELETPRFSSNNRAKFLFRLRKSSEMGQPDAIRLDYELSILSNGDSKVKSVIVSNVCFHQGNNFGTPLLITPCEIFSKREILPGDTLTVQCKMWHSGTQCFAPGFSLARTRIGSERKTFIWTIDKFSTLLVNDTRSVRVNLQPNLKLSLALTLFLRGMPTYNEKIRIKVEGNNEEKFDFIMVLGISVLNTTGNVEYHSEDEFKISEGKKEEWPFPLILEKKQFISNKDLLLRSDVLSLKCVLIISKFRPRDSIVLNEIEGTSYGADAALDLEAAITNRIESTSLGNGVNSNRNSLMNDMKKLFEDKYLTDINLRVRNEVFPAHKAVLAARSSVFKTMFDTDMKEKLSNTIEIDDIEPDTIRRLLGYVYGDIWEGDIQWENASSLCLAAEKYAVFGLKEKCSSFLKANLSLKNVCEILFLADILINEDLENSALSFIQENDKDVMNSNEWEHFAKKHPQLTVKILSRMYRNVKEF